LMVRPGRPGLYKRSAHDSGQVMDAPGRSALSSMAFRHRLSWCAICYTKCDPSSRVGPSTRRRLQQAWLGSSAPRPREASGIPVEQWTQPAHANRTTQQPVQGLDTLVSDVEEHALGKAWFAVAAATENG
jgi:hypothetical protein